MKTQLINNEVVRLLQLDKVCKNGLDFEKVLRHIKAKIKFLEGIYMSECNCGFTFSEVFRNAAYEERQGLCITSSALHKIIREYFAKEG